MKRRFPGLNQAAQPAEVPDGVYLVRVQRVQYRWHAQKPYYAVQFSVVEPMQFADTLISGRIYCTQKALWKLARKGKSISIEFPVKAGGTRTAVFETGGVDAGRMPTWWQ